MQPMYGGHHHHHHQSDVEMIGKAVVAVGCIAAIGYGFYKLCDWLFSPTDERIIQDSLTVFHDAQNRYDEIITFFAATLGKPETAAEKQILMKTFDESFLYHTAVMYSNKMYMYDLIAQMQGTISGLRSAHKTVYDRMKKLRSKSESYSVFAQMESIDKDICSLSMQLEFVHDYLAQHKSYFTLFEFEARLMNTYANELQVLEQYAHDQAYIMQVLRSCVMKHAGHNRTSYPYMHYVEMIQSDCNNLDRYTNGLSYNYGNRIAAARLLLQKLNTSYSMVITHDAYHQELRDYKKEQLEKERIAAEQAKAAAAQAQANAAAAHAAAAQQQAWAMQQQNALQAQQIRVDQDRNVILATQAIVNAINPPAAPQVNVFI